MQSYCYNLYYSYKDFFLSGYVDDLFEDLLSRRELHGTFAEAYEARRRDDKRRPPPLSHSTPRDPKKMSFKAMSLDFRENE